MSTSEKPSQVQKSMKLHKRLVINRHLVSMKNSAIESSNKSRK